MENKLIHVQTLLFKEDMEKLKAKSGESKTQEALTAAVEHYLNCDKIGDE